MSDYTALYSCIGWEGVGELEIAHIYDTISDFRLYIVKTGRTNELIWNYLLKYFRIYPSFRTTTGEHRPTISVDFHIPKTKKGFRDTLPPRAVNMGLLIVEKALQTYKQINQRKD